MKFQQTFVLLGVVGKKGSGKLDNGSDWVTDRVELHCVVPFPDTDDKSCGATVVAYPIQDFDKNYTRARMSVGQHVVLDFEMEPSKKLGQAGRLVCVGFNTEGQGFDTGLSKRLEDKKLSESSSVPDSVSVSGKK